MIRFPSTVSEYTDGKLWRGKREESIAKRILFSLDAIDDHDELVNRKLYLAYFYFDKGMYYLSAKILRELLLDMENIQDVLRLLERSYVQLRDTQGMSTTFSLLTKFDKEEEKRFVDFLKANNEDVEEVDADGDDTYVEYVNGQVKFFKDGQLLYRLEDNDYRTFFANIKANGELSRGQAKRTIDILDSVPRRHVKTHTLLSISVTYARAYLELGDYQNAFKYCKNCIEQDLYFESMLHIMLGAKQKGEKEIYDTIRAFLMTKKDLSTDDMVGLSSLIKEGETELWDVLCQNNPFDGKDVSEQRFLLEGINHYNKGENDEAEKAWHKADSLYGIFSRAKSYLYFLEKYGGKEKSGETLSLDRSSVIDDMIEVTLLEKLKSCNTKEDVRKNVKDIVLVLEEILTNSLPVLQDLADIMYKLYSINYEPVTSMIKGAVVNEEYFYIVRILALACFLALSDKQQFIYEGKVFKNAIQKLPVQEGKEPVRYALGMYFVQNVMREGKSKEKFVKKFYSLLRRDYKDAPSLAIFWLLLKYDGIMTTPEFFNFCHDKQKTLDFLYCFKNDMIDNIEDETEVDFCTKFLKIAEEMQDDLIHETV